MLRFPGFVKKCEYRAGVCEALISVRIHELFTVVTVNGLDIYFHRLTGSIDGIGFSQNAEYILLGPSCQVQQSERPAVPR